VIEKSGSGTLSGSVSFAEPGGAIASGQNLALVTVRVKVRCTSGRPDTTAASHSTMLATRTQGQGIVGHFRNRCLTIRYGPLVEQKKSNFSELK
jgi:hypothetical protein